MRMRRVGSITCGSVLILFGVLFLLRRFVPGLSYEVIFHLWPLVLILLGVELLIANLKGKEQTFKYDVGAVVLIVILAVFALIMGMSEFCMEHIEPPYIYFGP